MSGVKLSRVVESWVEIRCECSSCGAALLSDASAQPGVVSVVVQVSPCAACAAQKERA